MAAQPDLDTHYHFPDLIRFHWEHNPSKGMYAYPSPSTLRESNTTTLTKPLPESYDEITYLEFGRAVHRAAHFVRPSPSSEDGRDGEVVALLAHSDTLVYDTVIIGLMTANLVPLLISPRNSPAAVINLLDKTGCRRILATKATMTDLLDSVLSSEPTLALTLTIDEIPSLRILYPHLAEEVAEHPFEPYPNLPKLSFEDVAIYIHSSGSTGFPKPIPITHRGIWSYANLPPLRELRTHPETHPHETRLGGLAIPAFHALALILQLIHPLFGAFTSTIFTPIVWNAEKDMPIMPTPENTLDAMERTRTTATMIFPTFLQIWSKEEESVKRLARFEYVVLTGGPLDKESGDMLIANSVRLRTIYGGTEFGQINHLRPRPGDEDDWMWMEFNVKRVGVRWVGAGAGRGEIVLLHSETHVPAVSNLPEDLQQRFEGDKDEEEEVKGWDTGNVVLRRDSARKLKGYVTSDVWERHPTKPHLYRLVGRVDDVLIHSSGEKTVPGPLEKIILGNTHVKGVVIFGHGRAQPGVLIEPFEHTHSLGEFRNLIWQTVEAANAIAPAFSRIYKEMIIITSSDRPLPRTPKDTVIRKQALKVYEQDIDELYETIESNVTGPSGTPIEPPSSWSVSALIEWIINQAQDITSKTEPPLTKDTDLFESGFDSLSATILRLRLVSALRGGEKVAAIAKINQNTVYTYHTVGALAEFVIGALTGQEDGDDSEEKMMQEHIKRIEDMVAKYSVKPVSSLLPAARRTGFGKHVVLITGTTGSLGSQLLFDLLADSRVGTVYALNRRSTTSDIVERQKAKFAEKNLDSRVIEDALVPFKSVRSAKYLRLEERPRLIFLEGTSPQDLDEEMRNVLSSQVTMVIHNAWKLDFNLPLDGFEEAIKDFRDLVAFAQSTDAKLLFTSSISTAHRWAKEGGVDVGAFPEECQEDARYAVGGGYGEAKYVCERILKASKLNATSFRVGQITGSSESPAWSLTDWLPIIVKSGIEMHAMPDAVGVVSWIPGTIVSRTTLDVGFNDTSEFAVNVIHPKPTKWSAVMRQIVDSLVEQGRIRDGEVKIVPWSEWMKELERRAGELGDVKVFEKIPAIKLMHFYRGMAEADVAHRQQNEYEGEAVDLTPLKIDNAKKLSKAFEGARRLMKKDVDAWVGYWIGAGM
ncbi:nonribosomal peptide synthetase [Moniliophthora roreri MCA 2997]|uniref:Nonribosomal peptide synthetase n=2 Tax=Moniliophthora roreri TaxID=221103 RepID=V2WVI3_MONRO|nr:nonribosomal peptide synthetase [Moniliophthora roreri MCA 2997]KAI3616478.1 nonribosomal peptide synthetase [Moniliophthora roreri]